MNEYGNNPSDRLMSVDVAVIVDVVVMRRSPEKRTHFFFFKLVYIDHFINIRSFNATMCVCLLWFDCFSEGQSCKLRDCSHDSNQFFYRCCLRCLSHFVHSWFQCKFTNEISSTINRHLNQILSLTMPFIECLIYCWHRLLRMDEKILI